MLKGLPDLFLIHRYVAAVYVRCERIVVARVIPLLASPQGGVAASSIKWCEATEAHAAGVVFLSFSVGKPPRPRYLRMLRGILLIARPPLLALMQGGECARSTLPAKALHQRECFPSQTLGELTGRDFQAQWRRLSCPKR